MALRIPQTGFQNLLKDGYKHLQGLDEAVLRNIDACKQLAEVVQTSLGPDGMNKMVINHLEKLFITNDAVTIIKELEVVHPAAKLLVMASQQQESEIGDASNFVVVFGGQLLDKAAQLLRHGLHTADVIQGFEKAHADALSILDELVVDNVNQVTKPQELRKAVLSAVAAKQHGLEEILVDRIVEAGLAVMPKNPRNFNVDSVRVVKIMGGSVYDSSVLHGMLFAREPEGELKNARQAKVAIYTCGLDTTQSETKGTVLIHNAQEMLDFSKGEESALEKQIKEIADAGVQVIVVGGGIGELALHFANRMGLMAIKVLSKFDLRRLCKVTGATPLIKLSAPTPEEIGHCDVIETVEIGNDRCTVFRQEDEKSRMATIVLRGGTQNHLDDLERALDDGINVIKAVTRDNRLVTGAGACEMELARRLSTIGEKTPGLSQYAIKKYAEAFEVIPRTLAANAGLDPTESISALYAAHAQGQSNAGINVNLDVNPKPVLDAKEAGIFDVLSVKHWAIKLATEAALTILRVDQIIMSKPAGGPKPPKGQPQYDEDD